MPPTSSILTVSRSFKADVDILWDAWTNAEIFAQWFNPAPGFGAEIQEWEYREGGAIQFLMPQPGGDPNPQEGIFHEIKKPFKLVQGSVDKSAMVQASFLPTDPGTILTVKSSGIPEEHLAGAEAGWQAMLDKLAQLID